MSRLVPGQSHGDRRTHCDGPQGEVSEIVIALGDLTICGQLARRVRSVPSESYVAADIVIWISRTRVEKRGVYVSRTSEFVICSTRYFLNASQGNVGRDALNRRRPARRVRDRARRRQAFHHVRRGLARVRTLRKPRRVRQPQLE